MGQNIKNKELIWLICILIFYEYHEYSYHLILDGFFTGKGYLVQSEWESGYGGRDLFILDPVRMHCLLIELKHVQRETEMDAAVKEASSQIAVQKYESVLRYEGYITRLKYSLLQQEMFN